MLDTITDQKTAAKNQAVKDINSLGEKCYLNIEEKVLTYCSNASLALRLNRLSL
jgi:hypothetical protein